MPADNNHSDERSAERRPLIDEIKRLKAEKNAIVLAHYYVDGDIQDVADYVGDSLALAQTAAAKGADADIIVMCGVNFMGETVKMLCPDKKVLVPDDNAGCTLASGCPAGKLRAFIAEHPGHTVVSYVNTTLDVKALSDLLVTSSNAVKVVESLPADEKIIFGPDRNLGRYIMEQTGRDMVLWDACCYLHNRFDAEGIARLKADNPDAKVLVHPECPQDVTILADKVGSTKALLEFSASDPATTFIVATEPGILHKMRQASPSKKFIEAPVAYGMRNVCRFMKLNTLEKLAACLRDETPVVEVDAAVAERARRPLDRMLELS
ncbi:MAG: quinolinate synthase NadA [Muribaculaceae bacterium]|nr:quinolinate synthase NadA [Muribaculaceae bacterium]